MINDQRERQWDVINKQGEKQLEAINKQAKRLKKIELKKKEKSGEIVVKIQLKWDIDEFWINLNFEL